MSWKGLVSYPLPHIQFLIPCQDDVPESHPPSSLSNTSMGVAATATATARPMGGRLQLFGPKGTRARPGVKCNEFGKAWKYIPVCDDVV